MAKRKTHSAAFKAQVALAAVRGDRTMNQVAAQFGVHPTLIQGWRKKLLAGAAGHLRGRGRAGRPGGRRPGGAVRADRAGSRWNWSG
jgi:transposase-like protein